MELAVFFIFALCSANVVHGAGNILVLVDNINTQDTHSIFLNSLKGRKLSSLLCLWQHVAIVASCTDNACMYTLLH